MTQRLLRMAVLGAVFLLAGSALESGAAASTAQPYALSVSVRQAGSQNRYEWTVVAVEVATGKTVFAPKITSEAGKSASASTTNPDGVFLGITVTVDKTGRVGAYTFVATKNGEQVQKATGIVTVT
jgi:hypothetical protein